MLEAKAKVRRRHEEAIWEFRLWCSAHPRAKYTRKIQVFDALVDGVPIEELMKKRGKSTLIR